jgi:hypothetical protein
MASERCSLGNGSVGKGLDAHGGVPTHYTVSKTGMSVREQEKAIESSKV